MIGTYCDTNMWLVFVSNCNACCGVISSNFITCSYGVGNIFIGNFGVIYNPWPHRGTFCRYDNKIYRVGASKAGIEFTSERQYQIQFLGNSKSKILIEFRIYLHILMQDYSCCTKCNLHSELYNINKD